MDNKQDSQKNTVSNPIDYMEVDEFNNKHVISLAKGAKNIAIIPSKTAGAESVFAGVGLYYMLKEKFEDDQTKTVKFVYSGNLPEACKDIINSDEITHNLLDRELVISIDYSKTPANKVQYSTENEVLHLRVSPVPRDFETSRIKARITGFDFDLAFIIGAPDLADLGPIYNSLRHEINSTQKIVLDNTNISRRYGLVNIIDAKADTLSTLVFKYAPAWELTPNTKAAQALLKGISLRDKTVA